MNASEDRERRGHSGKQTRGLDFKMSKQTFTRAHIINRGYQPSFITAS
jgi:hypothetical protein